MIRANDCLDIVDIRRYDTNVKKPPDGINQTINISGTRFEVSQTTWINVKASIPVQNQADLLFVGNDVFIERHPGAFQAILYYHQGGQLHLPVDVCPSSFRRELQFFGVDEACLAKCCYTKYVTFFDDEEVLKILEVDETRKQQQKQMLVDMSENGGWKGVQAKMWLTLNEPFYSTAAKVYFGISVVVILVSLFALIASTHPEFRRSLNVNEWQEYFGGDWHKYKHYFTPVAEPEPEAEMTPEAEAETTSEPEAETTSEPEAETTSEPAAETTSEPEAETTSEPKAESTAEPEAETPHRIPMPENASVPQNYLRILEYICVALFSIDLIIRCVFCPNKWILLNSFLHWNDVFALAVMYITYIVEEYYPKEKYEASFLDIIHCLQIVRVFRLIRLVKHFVGFRVLIYAFKASFREMMLMTLFLNIAMLLFSAFAYFSGDDSFPSIPDAFWWSVVTMTTVGYGDIVPKIALSKVIGALCAFSGVCLLAIIIPIFVNNFVMFYAYSKVWGKKHTDKPKLTNSSNGMMNSSNGKITQVHAFTIGDEKNFT